MGDIDPALVIVLSAAAVIGGGWLYAQLDKPKKVRSLDDMLAEIGTTPDTVIQSNAKDVALCWDTAGQYFVYLNALTGTNRQIQKDEVHALDVVEDGLTVRHHANAMRGDMGEELAEGINRQLPGHLQDNVERLEINLKTKTGGPPMGYNIPVIEVETPKSSKAYKALRNELVGCVANWRTQLGLA